MSGRVLITPRSLTASGGAGLESLRETGFELVFGPAGEMPSAEQLARLLPGCAGWLAGVEPITAAVLEHAEGLRVISRNGTGVDNIDLEAAAGRGIEVRRVPGANAEGVAELALMLAMWALRGLGPATRSLREGGWERPLGRELAGARLGVVGCGAVGRRLVDLALAFGGEVLATDLRRPDDLPHSPSFEYLSDLLELLGKSDAVSLHVPALASGRPVIGAAELARFREGAVLVNTARASLVDEEAVLAALGGRLGAYATDVFATEPPGDSPLTRHPLMVATPHVGGYTAESVARATDGAVRNLLEVLSPS